MAIMSSEEGRDNFQVTDRWQWAEIQALIPAVRWLQSMIVRRTKERGLSTVPTAKDSEREGGLVKWAEESSELEFLLDVGGNVVGGQVSGWEVGQGVAWVRRGDE